MQSVLSHIQVNVPFTMLCEKHLDQFLKYSLNPEIGFDALALERYSLSDFNKIATKLHQHHLTITFHAPFIDLSPGSPDPSIRAITRHRFEQVLQLIPIFKPKTVVCHAGYDRKRYLFIKDIWFENSVSMWSWLGTCLKEERVLLVLENGFEDDPEDLRILFENLEKKNVGFCLDVGHQAVFSSLPLETWLESLGKYLEQVHLHDNNGREDSHLALGKGRINFPVLFNYLKTTKKDPPVITLEPHREEDLWPSVEYLKKVWPW